MVWRLVLWVCILLCFVVYCWLLVCVGVLRCYLLVWLLFVFDFGVLCFNSVGVGLLTCLGFFACLYVVWAFWVGGWAWAAVVWFGAIGTRLRMRALVVFLVCLWAGGCLFVSS